MDAQAADSMAIYGGMATSYARNAIMTSVQTITIPIVLKKTMTPIRDFHGCIIFIITAYLIHRWIVSLQRPISLRARVQRGMFLAAAAFSSNVDTDA